MLKTGFNFTLRLSQISEIYCSLVHLHTYIHRTLEFFPFYAVSTSSNTTITTLDAASTPQMSRLFFILKYLSIVISIDIFGVLHVLSREQIDIFQTVPAFHDLDISLGIPRGPVIYHPLGTYCSL